jgi:hypothetical protein
MKDTSTEQPSPILRLSEDWVAVVLGALLLVLLASGIIPSFLPSFRWSAATGLGGLLSAGNLRAAVSVLGIIVVVAVLGMALGGGRWKAGLLSQTAGVALLGMLAQLLAGEASVKALGLEYVLFALLLGMLGGSFGLQRVLGGAVRTELYIKTGLVLFGATIAFPELMKAGKLGILQALGVVAVVWYFALWLARRFRVTGASCRW